jgi:hypothetical protein
MWGMACEGMLSIRGPELCSAEAWRQERHAAGWLRGGGEPEWEGEPLQQPAV